MARSTAGIDARAPQRFAISEDSSERLRPQAAEPVPGPHFELGRNHAWAFEFDGTYEEFVAQVRSELAPAGVLEELLASRLVAAAWRLYESVAPRSGELITDEVVIAELEIVLARAVGAFERVRSARRAAWGHQVPSETVRVSAPLVDLDLDDAVPSDFDNEEGWSHRFDPAASVENPSDDEAQDDDENDPGVLWRHRLVLDPDVSDRSPVVKGTWITVGHVVTLVVDGWSWADILRAHPELSEDDIRACLTYSVEEERSGVLGL